MVFGLKNPSRRVFVQHPLFFISCIEKSLKTKDCVFQHRDQQSFLRFEEALALGRSAVFVGCQFIGLKHDVHVTVVVSNVTIIHVL